MHCTTCPILFHLMTMTKFPIRIPWGISYIDLIFSGKTYQYSVKWGDSRDTRVSNYSAKSLVWGFFLSFFISEKMIFMFSCKCVLAYGNKYLQSISCIRLPSSQKIETVLLSFLEKNPYISVIKRFEQILWNKWNRCFKRALLNIIYFLLLKFVTMFVT